jgi:glycyl-tRNA synthetase beta chain
MRWSGTLSFIRPIRWMIALYNLKTVPYSFAEVKSGNRSFGHRLLAPESFLVTDFASYKKETRKRFVIIDPNERHNKIKQGINDIAKKISGIVEEDDALLWKAAYSTEYPEVICGTFDKGFLTIPKEIIATAMKEHQGYFPVSEKKKTQNALPHFIAVINNKDKKGIIQKGCERVLRARLSDARFYFEEDCKLTLEKRVPALKGVSFQDKLGTLYDKTERIVAVSKWIAQKIEAVTPAASGQGEGGILEEVRRIAPLCKADLLTGVVREFPSLQGVMGRILTDRDGLNPRAPAIEEHYQPRFSGDALPKSLLGQILSVADKIDTIVGCFGIGMIPTGSEDPYALRRQGLGLVQILSGNRTFRPFFLPDLILESVRHYENQKIAFKTNPTLEVSGFLKSRMVFYLQFAGDAPPERARHDIVNTVLTNKTLIPFPPYDIFAMAEALSAFCTKPLFNPLITCYKRAARILISGLNVKVNPALFKEKAEGILWRFILEAAKEVDIRYERLDFNGVLEALATLYVPLNRFFTDVLVMDKDEEIRKNRMALLRVVVNLFDRFGDFSKIQEGAVSNG